MKVEDPKKRKRLTDQVARGELTLLKLRDKIEGRRPRKIGPAETDETAVAEPVDETEAEADAAWTGRRKASAPLRDDSLIMAKAQLADAVEAVLDVLRSPDVVSTIGLVDRANLAKYLTIAKLRLENAIAMVRSEGP